MILTRQLVGPPYYNWVDMILTLHPGGSPYYIKFVVIESMPLISISKYKIIAPQAGGLVSYLPNYSMEAPQAGGLVSYLPNYSMEAPQAGGLVSYLRINAVNINL
jgi:hypothetical protein